jgi:hypothetical protein
MKRLVIGILFSLTLACSTLMGTPPTASHWQTTVDDMASLTKGIGMPTHLERENATKTADDFDVETYFSVLKHLSLDPGFVLDYVYYFDGMGGYPVLYVRPEAQPPYKTFAEYARGTGRDASTRSYLEGVHVDDTPEGFFELATLDTMGNQFYLFWHAEYNDWRIVCTPDAARRVFETSRQFGVPIDSKTQAKALQLDFEPQVTIGDATVSVQMVAFSKWSGFDQVTYTIRRDFPHTILNVARKELVPFNCGVMF